MCQLSPVNLRLLSWLTWAVFSDIDGKVLKVTRFLSGRSKTKLPVGINDKLSLPQS